MLLEKDKRVSHKHQFPPEGNSYKDSDLMFSTPALPIFTSQTPASAQTSSHQEEEVPEQQEKPKLHQDQGRNWIQINLGNSQSTFLFIWTTLSF